MLPSVGHPEAHAVHTSHVPGIYYIPSDRRFFGSNREDVEPIGSNMTCKLVQYISYHSQKQGPEPQQGPEPLILKDLTGLLLFPIARVCWLLVRSK